MGTRSTIKFYDLQDQLQPVASIYHQYDGYISSKGYQLANWLKDKKILNGFGNQVIEEGYANGMSCLAAQYIKDFKTRLGGLYMTYPDDLQDYNYEIRYINGEIIIKVDDIFEGTPDELLNFKE